MVVSTRGVEWRWMTMLRFQILVILFRKEKRNAFSVAIFKLKINFWNLKRQPSFQKLKKIVQMDGHIYATTRDHRKCLVSGPSYSYEYKMGHSDLYDWFIVLVTQCVPGKAKTKVIIGSENESVLAVITRVSILPVQTTKYYLLQVL